VCKHSIQWRCVIFKSPKTHLDFLDGGHVPVWLMVGASFQPLQFCGCNSTSDFFPSYLFKPEAFSRVG
jgi:hypothetical protein